MLEIQDGVAISEKAQVFCVVNDASKISTLVGLVFWSKNLKFCSLQYNINIIIVEVDPPSDSHAQWRIE